MKQFELLENRRLLSASSGQLPSLDGTIDLKTAVAAPGEEVSASLKIDNHGGNLLKNEVPIGIYVNGSKVITLSPTLSVKAGKSKNVPLVFNLPSTDIPTGNVDITAEINDGGGIQESNPPNSTTAILFDPVGTYTGEYEFKNGEDSMSVDIFTSGGKLFSNLILDDEAFGVITASDASTAISSTGELSVHTFGSSPDISGFVLTGKGVVDPFGHSINGSFTFVGHSRRGPFKNQGRFSVTES